MYEISTVPVIFTSFCVCTNRNNHNCDLRYMCPPRTRIQECSAVLKYVTTSIVKTLCTRKCSCVNARSILTAAYQVPHMLSCRGYVLLGVLPCQGVPHLRYPPSDLASPPPPPVDRQKHNFPSYYVRGR